MFVSDSDDDDDDEEFVDIETQEIRRIRELWEILEAACFINKAMTALPPAECFCEDQTKESRSDNCCICLEEFKNGDFIQPFGVCRHEFHSSCVQSWVLAGNITCPLCRQKLPINV